MNFRALYLGALVLCGLAVRAQATTLVRLSLEQLVEASSEIVRGRVISQESRWNSDHTQIVTLTTISIDQTVKGSPPAPLVIEQPGGTVGNIHVRVAGTVHFRPQEQHLLFLEPSTPQPSRYVLVGMVQGAYRIYREPKTNEEHVVLPLAGISFGLQDAEGGVKRFPSTVSLSQFRTRLANALIAPIVIPRGASLPLVIQATESRGVGRVRIQGRTTVEIYPNARVVIPAGSSVEGTAQLVAGSWKIRWTEVSIRGQRVPIYARSEEPAGATLRGRALVINVR